MRKILGSGRIFGLGALSALLAIVACSDDGHPNGAAGSAGTAGGGSASGGSGAGKGGSAPNGGSAGQPRAGSSGGGSAPTAGSGGAAGAGGANDGGMEAGGASSGGAGGADEGGAGGMHEGGAGGMHEGGAGGMHEGGAGGAGPEPVACAYTEVEADQAQDTPLTATDTAQVICGQLNPGQFDAGSKRVDRDGYYLGIASDADVLIRIDVPGWQALTKVEVSFDGNVTTVTGGRAVFRRYLPFGSANTVITVRGYANADIAQALPYQLSLTVDDIDTRCAASAGAVTYAEANDGPGGHDNDVYEMSFDTASLTAASDTAEPSGVTVAASPASYRIDGTSADVTSSTQYDDGDSYAFRTGPSAEQLTIRADWAGANKDVDVWLFKAGETVAAGSGISRLTTSGEYLTAVVAPATDYVLYAATYKGVVPLDYSLTLCSEAWSIDGN